MKKSKTPMSQIPIRSGRSGTKYAAQSRDALRPDFYRSVAEILENARSNAYRAVNFAMVEAYWQVGRMIVEEEQHGKERAEYGAALIQNLSLRLTAEFGKGFSEQTLRNFRQFYLAFPIFHTPCGISSDAGQVPAPPPSIRSTVWSELTETLPTESPVGNAALSPILSTVWRELSWSHYKLLIRVGNEEARAYYAREAADQNWSVRALERQINSLYYERLLASRDKVPVTEEMQSNTHPLADRPEDFIKDPYVLEFLNLGDQPSFRESELEQAILGKLQAFLLELGRGFAFVARQQRLSTEASEFFVDLVFYNYLLKCFVLIDLKTGKLTHQDIGQMDMYVRLYEDTVRGPDDNPTIGIILCTEKDKTIVKYSVLNENRQLFASKYQLYLPTEEELQRELEREKQLVLRERGEPYRVKG